MLEISIVSPVYRAEGIVDQLVLRVSEALNKITPHYEIILVEDGGPDNSWGKIQENCQKFNKVKGIKLSRNFGQHYAIAAGLEHAKAEWVVIMDCDLQDLPEEIEKLYNKAKQGYDIVLAKRENRQDNFLKKTYSKYFYKVLSYLTGTMQDSSIANFGIFHKHTIAAVNSMNDRVRYFPTMIRWVGFKVTTLNVVHAEREIGKSAYSFRRAFNLALDVMIAFSDKPLRLTIKVGLIIALISFLFAIRTIIMAINGEIEVMGYASLMVSIWFLFGLTIFIMGIMGLYIGKTFEGVKGRPLFIISKVIN